MPSLLPSRPIVALVAAAVFLGQPRPSAASECPDGTHPLDADRPDVTNSSLVVPRGSVQFENGVNWAVYRDAQLFDGPETRVRVGLFRCGELLFDVPNYVRTRDGATSSFSTPVISVKRQLFIESPTFSLSAAAGVGVPSRAIGSPDRGYTPYVQFPWSRSLDDEWSVNGMATVTWSTVTKTLFESTLTIEHEFNNRGDLFAEYVGDYTKQDRSSQVVDVGGGWHVTPTQQVDFHLGAGLTRTAPRHYVGIGYSFRFDGVVARHSGARAQVLRP
jgi:hypothetical protein